MRTHDRGFTLTELLVAAVVMAVVAAGALALMSAQQGAFKASAGDRALQETARAALSELGMNLRRAGYGVDPWLAIDFGPLTAAPVANRSYPGGPPDGTAVSCTSSPVTCRDSTGATDTSASDEIVFYARDPAFGRFLNAAATTSALALSAPLSQPLQRGQILQVMCSGAADWAYVTVSSISTDLLTVNLDTSVTTGEIPFQQARLTSGCFRNFGTVAVFKIDRFHYYVRTFSDPAYPSGRPYLMLDRGLLDGSGNRIAEPVAPDVEDVQFAYVLRSGTVVGAASGTRLASSATSVDLGARPPAYDSDSSDPLRATNSPANVRAVRVSVVVRSPAFDARLADRTMPAALNRPENASAPSGYRRILVETTEATRNLDSRGAFMPPYISNIATCSKSSCASDGVNVGGG